MHILNIKKSIVHMAHYSNSSHVGACLSIADILYTLYFKVLNVNPADPCMNDRDKFLLSKGHSSAALYATLSERGFFPKSYLEKFYIDGGVLPGHLDRESVPGIEVSSGSLGHGLSLGVGMALANKISGNKGKIYVLLGDGECNEGSVWEAVMLASTLGLANLTAIVDLNGLQGFGKTNEVVNQSNLPERWSSFGWEVHQVDGHNHTDLKKVFTIPQTAPKVVIAHTVKGKGVSFMENRLEWHYKSPNNEQYEQAVKELECLYEKHVC